MQGNEYVDQRLLDTCTILCQIVCLLLLYSEKSFKLSTNLISTKAYYRHKSTRLAGTTWQANNTMYIADPSNYISTSEDIPYYHTFIPETDFLD